MKYVDRLTKTQLRHHYPEVDPRSLVEPDIIDDAESLASIEDNSQSFLIASHVLEHCEDPISALSNWLRVLEARGVLFLAVPDKRFTFDRHRDLTSLQHLFRDHHEGPAVSRAQHYREWVEQVVGAPQDEVAHLAKQLEAVHYSIHFHVWDHSTLLELLSHCCSGRPGAQVLKFQRNRSENLALVRKH